MLKSKAMVVLMIGMCALAWGQKLSNPGTFPVVDKKVTITVAVPAPTDATVVLSENRFLKEYEAKTNIHVEWMLIPQANFKEKINLMMASGDLPDVICTGVSGNTRFDKTQEAQFGAQGLIIPLNRLIESQSVWFKKVLEEQKGLKEYITTPDGNIYALPYIDDAYHVIFPQKLWLNTTWLKKLNMAMPTTPDELYRVLKAFKEKDPNGNGKADEVAFSTVKSGTGFELDGFLMSPFVYSGGKDRLYLENGVVKYAPVENGYKEGLKYLAKLYKEGLINPESFVIDTKAQVNLNESGDAPVLGAFPGLHMAYGTNLTASKRWEQYSSLPPLKGPDGKARTAINPFSSVFQTGMYTITSSCKNPEIAFRFADWLYSEEGTHMSQQGFEGINWLKATDKEFGVDGRPAKYTQLKLDTKLKENQNLNVGQMLPAYRPRNYFFSFTTPQDPYGAGVDPNVGRQRVFYTASQEHEKVAPDLSVVLPELYFSAEDIGEMSLLKTTITDYTMESLVKFVTGQRDIDREWQSHLSQFNRIGLSQYLQIIQKNYDAQYKRAK